MHPAIAQRGTKSVGLGYSRPRFAFDVVDGHGANEIADNMHPAFAERGTTIVERGTKSVGPK